MGMKKAAADFLSRHGMLCDDFDLTGYIRDFQDEMNKGLAGEKSSLAMIPTYIDAKPEIPRNKKVVVLDAGGTNLRSALVHFDVEGKGVIEKFSKIRMPGYERQVSLDEFYTVFADRIKEFADESDAIGFCFSYPADITPECDAIPTVFTKEIKAPEVLGKSVADNLRAYLKKAGARGDQRVVVLNDTVATLLTGMAAHPDRSYDGYMGYILGTGLNSCYLESTANIPKIKGKEGKFSHQIINTESGGYARLARGTADDSLDRKTVCPGDYFQEKLSSGGYFGAIVQETLELAASESFLAAGTAEKIAALGALTTIDGDNYLHNPQDSTNRLVQALAAESEEEKEKVYWLIDFLLERAAKVTAGSMAAVLLKTDYAKNILHPFCLTVDGTTFYAYCRFRFRVESYLKEALGGEDQRYYEIVRVEDAPLLGAAIAALTN
ncbi:MAG: hexokinase [Spirochaetales bacterium]|nr:hexokinase [Spirochaetales bacterium]